jgi:hypothetical protein
VTPIRVATLLLGHLAALAQLGQSPAAGLVEHLADCGRRTFPARRRAAGWSVSRHRLKLLIVDLDP